MPMSSGKITVVNRAMTDSTRTTKMKCTGVCSVLMQYTLVELY